MRKFEKPIQKDTLVKIEGLKDWHTVAVVRDDRSLIKVYNLAGSFQRGHITKYTNKKM